MLELDPRTGWVSTPRPRGCSDLSAIVADDKLVDPAPAGMLRATYGSAPH